MSKNTKVETKRFNLAVDLKTFDLIDKLCIEMGAASLTEVIRRSIRITHMIVSCALGGEKIILRKADGTERELVVIPSYN